MGKSLQEQLLAAGAARPKQAKKARREKAAQAKAARRQGKPAAGQSSVAPEIDAAQAAKRERDRELNDAQKRRREARERDAAIAQLVAQHAVPAGGGAAEAVAYNYEMGGRIRRIEVSDRQRRELAAGRLGIVRHRGQAALVPEAAAERIAALVADAVWLVAPHDERPDPNDPYADFPVPDDLMW